MFVTIDSLDIVNKNLEKDKRLAYNEIRKQKRANTSLTKENETLNKTLEKGALLTANSFNAKSYSLLLGRKRATNRAKKVQAIEVCFTLAENALTEQGAKELYIQIVNPQNNVLADKGAIDFGDTSLIYSTKKVIDYNNEVLEVCVDIEAENDEQPLTKGTYFVHVFNNDRKLGSTEIKLN